MKYLKLLLPVAIFTLLAFKIYNWWIIGPICLISLILYILEVKQMDSKEQRKSVLQKGIAVMVLLGGYLAFKFFA